MVDKKRDNSIEMATKEIQEICRKRGVDLIGRNGQDVLIRQMDDNSVTTATIETCPF